MPLPTAPEPEPLTEQQERNKQDALRKAAEKRLRRAKKKEKKE